MVVKVLGPLETGTDPLGPRERTVLSALIVRVGSAVAPTELADAWWGDSPPRTWEQQIRNSVARIRGRLGRSSIETLGWEYRLGLEPDSIDAFRFERLVSTARGHVLRSEHGRAVDAYRRALALWRGAPLQDVARWEPGLVEAMRLGEIRSSAEEELLDARLASGEHRSLIPDAERLLREDPLREDRWAIVALANYRANRQAEALAVVRRARERLADELGVEPGARLAALELAMLRGDPTLAAPSPPSMTTGTCPYPGLRPFGPDDSELFFGREADIDILLERIQSGAVVTIAGASGTGKSSLLLAGIVPRLRARGLAVEVVRPSLGGAGALLHAGERAQVIAIDQAEELLAAHSDDVDAFARAAGDFLDEGKTILVTLRSDGLDRLRALPDIGDAIGRGVYLLGGLSDAAYRRAIEAPAHQAGLALEAGLIEIAVRDAGDRSSTLPHLSHAMQETWTRREGATLTVDGYERSGGIPGAIAQSAEDAFQALSPDDQIICRSLMLRLIDRGADGTSTRRRVAAEPLLSDSGRRRVLEQLTRARLVTLDGDAVFVAHEAVASAWPRLDAWLAEDAEGARTLRAVEVAAAAWAAGGREDDDLLRGARLHSALTWRDVTDADMTRVEEAFLTASDAREQGEIRELRDRAGRERRRNRVLGGALGGAGVLLVAALVAGSFAAIQGREAAEAAEDAQIEAIVATSLSLHQSDRELSALLGAEAYRRWPDDSRVRSALLGAMISAQGLVDTHRPAEAADAVMAVIPGTGTALRVAEPAEGSTIEIVEPASGDVLRSFDVELPPRRKQWFRTLSVSRDGAIAAIQTGSLIDAQDTETCCWNHLTFIDLATGEKLPGSQLLRMRTHEIVDLGEDGSHAFLQHPFTGALIVVDTRTGEVRASARAAFYDYTGLEPDVPTTGAAADGDRVAAGTGDRVDVFDRDTLAVSRSMPLGGGQPARALGWDGAGGLLVSTDEQLLRVRTDTGAVDWRRPLGADGACYRLILTPRSTIACSSFVGITEFELATGLPTGRAVALQLDTTTSIGILDDTTLLISKTLDGFWMRWRFDGSGAGSRVVGAGHVLAGGPDRDGGFVATQPVAGGAAQLWDLDADAGTDTTADGLALLGGGIVDRWDEGVGHRLQDTATGDVYPYRIPGLPDDFHLISGGLGPLSFAVFRSRLVAFDPTTGKAVGEPMRIPGWRVDWSSSASATPDESRVAFTWWDERVGFLETAVFDLSTGDLVARGLPGVDETLVIGQDELIAVTAETVQRVALGTLEPTSSLARATGGSRAMDLSLDGRTLLNVGWNGRLTLYDLTRDIVLGEPIVAEIVGLRGGYLTPDGETLITTLRDGILLWDLVPEHQALAACELAGRELSAQEWVTYFPGEEQVATCASLGA